ncbi:hypothetical protein U3516DRAFT_646460 [Neocallimastix sp. 'constans']|jgi:hypothetical protein
MEKYSHWRDSGTGIQPFLPLKPPKSNSALDSILYFLNTFILGPPLATIRFIFILFIFIIYLIQNLILIIIPGPLKWIVGKLFFSCEARLVLLYMGFNWIDSQKVTLTRGRKHTKKETTSVNHGDIIACNCQSYVDIIYFFSKFNPVFVKIFEDGKVKQISFLEAIKNNGSYPELKEEEGAVSLKDIIKESKEQKKGPIVVFPEGTTTNGKGLLKFLPVFKEFTPKDDITLHVYSIKYQFYGHNVSYTVGSKFVHFYQLCSKIHHAMTVKYLTSEESQFNDIAAQAELPNSVVEGQLGAHISKLIGQVLRIRKTGLGAKDKQEFLDYYNEINKKGYKNVKKSK